MLLNSVYLFFIVGWQLGNTMDPAMIWRDRITSIVGRLGVFVETILQGEKNQDPLMFVFLMGILLWTMSSFGVWILFRKRGFWPAILPPGIMLITNQILFIGSTELDGYLIFYMFMILIIASRLDIWRRKLLWQKLRAQVAPNTIFAFSRAGVILAILIVLLAWGGPAFARSDQAAKILGVITIPFDELRDKLADALGGLRGSVGVSYGIYGENLNLEAGVKPADILVMHITAEERPQKGGRFYWFARAYNIYESGSWKMSIGETMEFDPVEGDLPHPPYSSRQTIQVEVSPKVPSMHAFYAPSQLLWASRSGEVDVYSIPNGTVDIIGMTKYGVVREGESYSARSSIAVPTTNELREASTEYPRWVNDNYLQVAESITERTRQLAHVITEGSDNPFDKAAVITQWLRTNIDYERVTQPPPQDVEQIDWFLFDYQVGFCNWYASAEVILLRTLGIPARMAVGYARGNFHTIEGYYEVSAADAHAWPEVFFPGYGWVEFEPTGNQSVLNRPEEREPIEGASDSPSNSGRGLDEGLLDSAADDLLDILAQEQFNLIDRIDFGSLITWLIFIVLLVAIVIFSWFRFDPVSWVSALATVAIGMQRIGIQPPHVLQQIFNYDLTPTGKIYSRWSVWLRRLGIPMNFFQTPNERAMAFGEQYPPASTLGWKIVDSYVQERFGGVSLEHDAVKETWHDLRPYLWIEWIRKKIGLKLRST
jgi:transglutaminase-like putative cysteine protease